MRRFWSAAFLGAAMLGPILVAPSVVRADDRVYHDRDHNDDHHWDKREDRAYRMWAREQHRKYVAFNRLRAEDQAAYWNWRHEHSDAVLHIDIR